MCKALGLVDIWRILNPCGRDFTFFSTNPQNLFKDRFLFIIYSKPFIPSVIGCSIGSIIIFDHTYVGLDLLPHSERQRSYRWRLNSSILQDPENIEWMKAALEVYILYYTINTNWSSVTSVGVAWEALKAVLRGRIIQYTSFVKKLRAKELLELEKRIKSTESELKRHMAGNLLRELTQLKYQYNNILSKKSGISFV